MKRLIVLLLLIIGCKEPVAKQEKTSKPSSIDISRLVLEFSNSLKEGDTIVFDFNLTMEHYVRNDILSFTNSKGNILVGSKIIHGVEELDDGLETEIIQPKSYLTNQQDSISIESLIRKNFYRTERKRYNQYLLKAYSKKDTFYLYSYNLADRSSFIQHYFEVTSKIFPNEKAYLGDEEMLYPKMP